MALTREEALAAAKAADVYPTGFGGRWFAKGCGCPATAVSELRGHPIESDPNGEVHGNWDDFLNVAAIVCPSGHGWWFETQEMISLLDSDPPEVARRLRDYAASLPEVVSP